MASSLTNDWQDQLVALRGLTALMGVLHEAQVLQLKLWGAVAFAHVPKGKWEVRVDMDARTVTYVLPRRKRAPAQLPKLVAALDRSVHWLLGDEWALHITENNQAVYQGQRQVAEEKTDAERKSRAARRAGVSIAK